MSTNYVGVDQANLEAFSKLPVDEPIHMLNFLKYRDLADYPDGHEHAGKGWSGRRAYQEYIAQIGPIFDRIGARGVWRGSFQLTTLGPADESWDDMLIAEYPNAQVFMEMVSSPEYQKVGINRTAAIEDSRLYRTTPAAQDFSS